MKYILLLILIIFTDASKLNLNECREETVGTMEFRVCDDIEPYSKVYFHDPTGENQITIVPDRLYKNHGYYVAYSKDSSLFVANKKYSKETWFNHIDHL